MMGPTHAAAGLTAAACVLLVTHAPHDVYPLALAAGAGAALLPDIDEPHSTVNRYAVVIGPAIGHAIRHRTVTHSLAALAGLMFLVRGIWPAIPPAVWLAIGAGFASHLVTDALTPDGAMWFWPILPWRVSLTGWLPDPLARIFRTGGALERIVVRNAFLAAALYVTAAAWRA